MTKEKSTKKVKLVCERCRGQFVLKVPRLTGALYTPHPAFIGLKGGSTIITLCPDCQKEFDEMAPEE